MSSYKTQYQLMITTVELSITRVERRVTRVELSLLSFLRILRLPTLLSHNINIKLSSIKLKTMNEIVKLEEDWNEEVKIRSMGKKQ